MKKLKVTLLPPPGAANQTGWASYEQSEFVVDDAFDLYIAPEERWFQFEAYEGDAVTTLAFPVQRIVALALAEA